MFNLLPYATALDNVLLPLGFAPERRARVGRGAREEALRLILASACPRRWCVARPAAELSVGRQQRVAVARALIGAPALIVADEPTSALDEAAQGAGAGASLLMVAIRPGRAVRGPVRRRPGAEAAQALGYRLGDEILASHGLASFRDHADKPFRVAGAPVDRTVQVSLEAIRATGRAAAARRPGAASGPRRRAGWTSLRARSRRRGWG